MGTKRRITGKKTGQCVRHGTHALSVPAVFEVGGPKGSTIAVEHEVTTPGFYTCPDSDLTVLLRREGTICHGPCRPIRRQHCPQCHTRHTVCFRGEETVEGVAHRKVKSLGCTDQQYICARNNHIIWNELQGRARSASLGLHFACLWLAPLQSSAST